jgi:glycosyltransferase involved in cell wall biosynthesis
MKNCKKILFVITSLGGGGAEKVFLNILKYLDREKFIPYLVVFSYKGEYLSMVPQDIIIYDLNKKNRFDLFKLIILLAFRIYPKIKPDIVISFQVYANLVVLIARKLSSIKPFIIISERNHTLLAQKDLRMQKIKRMLVKMMYSQADKVIALSKGVAINLLKFFKVPKDKIHVIYNGTDIAFIKCAIKEPVNDIAWIGDDTPIIITCARLTYQKNYPLLLDAFAIMQKQIDSKLLILGQGEDRVSVEELARRLGIQEKVIFLGFQKNPYKYMAASDIFVLSSLWEGFGNVVIEAMVCGVPVISTRCRGPEEIITNGRNGILVPGEHPEAMAGAIIRLLKDKRLAEHLIREGHKRIEDFRVEKMIAEYEKVILWG